MPKDQPIIVKKVRKSREGHHGGSWKVAFADFMTAMMAFFLVMWIIGLDQETRSAIAGYFNDPLNYFKRQQAARMASMFDRSSATAESGSEGGKSDTFDPGTREEQARTLRQLQEQVGKLVEEEPDLGSLRGYVQTEMNEEGLVIELMEGVGSVFFETGSAFVKPPARKLFGRLSRIVARTRFQIVVDGHTDARQYVSGASYDNTDLSLDRAAATARVLKGAGMAPRQILACRGFGDQRLKDPSQPFSFVNRRVTVLVPYTWRQERVVGHDTAASGAGSAAIREEIDIAAEARTQ